MGYPCGFINRDRDGNFGCKDGKLPDFLTLYHFPIPNFQFLNPVLLTLLTALLSFSSA